MNVETVIYSYLAICGAVIIFNIASVFVLKSKDIKLQRRAAEFERIIKKCLKDIEEGRKIDASHMDFLMKKLRNLSSLTAFDTALKSLKEENRQAIEEYLLEINPVFENLMGRYIHDRDVIKVTYFAYVVSEYGVIENHASTRMLRYLLRLLRVPSIYCRENALHAIYSSGDEDAVLKALKIVDEIPDFHHSKLVYDGMYTFCGNNKKLIEKLLYYFDSYSLQMQVAIMDYIRFTSGDYCKEMMEKMSDSESDDEIKFCCIRYFGRYRYEHAYPMLLDFAANDAHKRWEYASIASQSLAEYPSEHTVEILKENLHSREWYVRFNAAQSLEKLGVTYLELQDIFDGSDRYAREMLQYRFDQRELEKGGAV